MLMFFKNLLSLILPPRCIKCGKVLSGDDGLCPDCFSEITFITAPYCAKCGRPFEEITVNRPLVCPQCIQDVKSPFRLSRSAFVYDDASKPLILSFKFHDKTENAKVLALQMKRAGADIFRAGIDVIVPVPVGQNTHYC